MTWQWKRYCKATEKERDMKTGILALNPPNELANLVEAWYDSATDKARRKYLRD